MKVTAVIRVDTECLEKLKERFQAFDTYNTVVRKLLGMEPKRAIRGRPKGSGKNQRAAAAASSS